MNDSLCFSNVSSYYGMPAKIPIRTVVMNLGRQDCVGSLA